MDLLGLVFPRRCLVCNKEGRYLCEDCLKKEQKAYLICPECGKASYKGKAHSYCKRRSGLDGLFASYRYHSLIRKAILRFKYSFSHDLAAELADLFIKEFKAQKYHFKEAVLVPIPLHKARERWRGFNQSAKLGKIIANELDFGFELDLLIRTKSATPQAQLPKKERLKNVKNIFSLNPKHNLQNTRYIIFDDVWTTGSTIKEACKILKKAGAKEVWGMTLAR